MTVELLDALRGVEREIILNGETHLKVKVPKGLKDGQKIRLKGQGMPGQRGGDAGDLFITVHVTPHRFLRRDGDDLYLEAPVTVKEAMYGAKIEIPTLDGTIMMTVPPGSQAGRKLRLKGKGVSTKAGQGDLYVTLVVRVPDATAGDAVKNAADALEQAYTGSVRAELKLD
jgi:DnaJ-class molecular chaperone